MKMDCSFKAASRSLSGDLLCLALAATSAAGAGNTPTPTPSTAAAETTPASRNAGPSEAYSGPEQHQAFFQAYWNEGIKYRLLHRISIEEDGRFRPHLTREPLVVGELGVKLQVDAAAYVEGDGMQHVGDDIEVRRSFLTARGTFFNILYPIDFSVEMGVITSSFFVNQAYLRLNDLPYLGTFKLGQYTAPMSFESVMNSRDIDFMESASPVQAFAPGKLAGIQLANHLQRPRLTWALGLFAEGQDGEVGNASKDFASVVGRSTWVPLHDETAGRTSLLHLGFGLNYLFSAGQNIRYQSRPESFLAPIAIDTDVIEANQGLVLNTELAFLAGPLSGQFEAFYAQASGGDSPSLHFPGTYVQINHFLTGEERTYDGAGGVFGQVLPLRPFSIRRRTWGAWEWGVRYSYTDLDSGPVSGGKMHAANAGVNWYWNRYVRFQFDYVLALVDDGALDGTLNVFQMRFQLVL